MKSIKALLSVHLLVVILFVSSASADDCEDCTKDHQRICKEECIALPQNYSKDNCHKDCVRSKCQSLCKSVTPVATPKSKAKEPIKK